MSTPKPSTPASPRPTQRGRAWVIPAGGVGLAGLLTATEILLGVGYPPPYTPPEAPLMAAALGLPLGMLLIEVLQDLRTYGAGRKGLFLLLGVAIAAAGSALPLPIAVPPSLHGSIVGLAILHELIDYRPTSSTRLLLVMFSLLAAAWHELIRFPAPAALLAGIGVGIVAWCVARIIAGSGQ